MKNTGIVRKLDELGRITLPIELRRVLNIAEKDPVEIYTDEDAIILKKYEGNKPVCALCGSTEKLKRIRGKYICRTCSLEVYATAREA
jgi:transcriptional pleiotropic regulator of transition state genes